MKGKHTNHAKANRQHRWSDKRMFASNGYAKIRVGRTHPLADPNGYAYEHLVVWCSAGNPRPVNGQILHHKNEVKTDNRIENLEVVSRAEHNRQHNKAKVRDSVTGRFAGRLLDGREWNELPEATR